MSDWEVLAQQLITGSANGMIIALIAIGYTMVFGIVEQINFAHGDLFMLGCFFALTTLGVFGLTGVAPGSAAGVGALLILLLTVPVFCAALNWAVNRYAYRPLRNSSKLAPLVSALGVSFIFVNIGLFWGGLPLEVFGFGNAAASPKDFPALLGSDNLLGESSIYLTYREVFVVVVTVPLLAALTYLVRYTRLGRALRATAQNPAAAQLMGVDSERAISLTFVLGGALAGVASVVYALAYNTVFFQMGFRVGVDAFTAAVLGGIGNLPGACLGGLAIGIIRALSDQYIATQWTNSVVFGVLIAILVFRPSGLLGTRVREKV
jgi:branched-chain amino acid transport system permease protein